MTILYCFQVYPLPEGLLELEGLELGYFELEVCVGLEGLLLECFDFDFEPELECFEPECFELECFELECFELWCFELECLWLELGGLGGFLCPPLGGYSSRGSLIFEHLLTPGNSLTLRLDLSRLRPLVAMSNWRIASRFAWVIACVSIPGGFGTLFPITAKVSHWPFGYRHVPAVHIELGLYMPGANKTIGTAIGCGGWVFWIATNEIPVNRNNTPPAGMHVCTANARILPSQTLHCPVLKDPHWGTALVYWYVERALFRAFAGLPEAVISGYRWPLWHPNWLLWYIALLAWFWMPCKKVKLIISNDINRKRIDNLRSLKWQGWDRQLLFPECFTFAGLGKVTLNFSRSSFLIRVNPLYF